MNRFIAGRLIYPLAVLVRGEQSVFREVRRMRAAQWHSEADLAARQERRLLDILQYAAGRSPYYRDRLKGVEDVSTSTVRDWLNDVPLLTKQDLQTSAAALAARPAPRRVRSKTTGGSTGQAVTVLKDGPAIGREMAASWLGYGWWGIEPGDRGARFWGSPHSARRRLRFAAADLAMNRIRFSAFAFTDADLEEYWHRCLRFRPKYFYGYVSMLEEFARYVRRVGHDGRRLGLRAVITTSEVLSDEQRVLLHEVFGAPVRNEYGCGEVGPIAYECPHASLHLMSENLFVEVLAADGRRAAVGESGQIVVTDLNNRAMPLIRYAVGDQGILGDRCPCGRHFPVLARIWGRAYDFVETPARQRFHGEFFMYYFEDLRRSGIELTGFQVIQKSADLLEVRLALPAGDDAGVESLVKRGIEERLPGMNVTLVRVAAVERAASGKVRLIINEHARPDAPPS